MTTPVVIMDGPSANAKQAGTAANPIYTTSAGAPATLGRKSAAQSSSAALSNEDSQALANASGTYKRATATGATSDGLFVTGVTTAGTITITLSGGGNLTVNVPLGSSILPFSVSAASLGTAVGGTFSALFFV